MATNYQTEAPQFTNSFAGEQPPVRERTGSRDYSNTDEWDASKTPPSRFQKRKGSIYATPPSRDGHVERNRDAVEEFHKAHSKRWSVSSTGSSRRGSVGNILGSKDGGGSSSTTANSDEKQRRKASQ
ncbi:hypothetical protein F4776DRAFT_660414 [Hypoxylon sp. NC0597]|nr:hypothetical protein F4776DRAFT_660414 [Hypoxylon sp. NC0597]